jgi:hypothetical protein
VTAEPISHAECREFVRRKMAELGCEITVSTAPPLVEGEFENAGFRCPHGTTFWMQPTGEQIAAWARDGVA